jgi:uroporphyrin-III C-methyltransferase/precorrin-2 dehydrogenase/sirohydrochlorin ferrochelatase
MPGSGPHLYPVFLRLDGRRVVVVGGGQVAAAKLPALLASGARITVVAPVIRQEIAALGVELVARPFERRDLEGASYVVAASIPEVNREVAVAAEARHLFVNVVDDTSTASAFLGGVVRRDGVTVAISTDGEAPALAGLLREALDALLPQDLVNWVATAREARKHWKAEGLAMSARRPRLLTALNALYEQKARDAGGER